MTAAAHHAPPCAAPLCRDGWTPAGECPRCLGSALDERAVAPDRDPRGLHRFAVERAAFAMRAVLARMKHPRSDADAWTVARAFDEYPGARRQPIRLIRACCDGLDEDAAREVLRAAVAALEEHARVMRGDNAWRRDQGAEDMARAIERVAEELSR